MWKLSVWALCWMGSAWAQDSESEPEFVKPMLTLETGNRDTASEFEPVFEPTDGVVVPHPDQALRFARSLSDQNLGLLAYPEYLRVADAHPKTPLADRALYEAGMISMEIRSPVEHYRWAAEQVTDAQRPHFLLLSQREIYRESLVGYSSVDVDTFVDTMQIPELSAYQDVQHFMLGSIHLYEDNDDAAVEQFGAIQDGAFRPAASTILTAIETRDLPKRHPKLAGLLSILVPGTGEMYGGDVQAGVSNLLVTGLAGLGTWYAYGSQLRWLFTGRLSGNVTLYIRQIE